MTVQAYFYRWLLTCIVLILFVAAPVFSGHAAASSYAVYVGYADDLRPSPFFPTPWSGAPNVGLFAGSTSPFDAGAIMILNTGSSSLAIGQGLSVNLHPTAQNNVFTLWNGSLPFALAPFQSAIFTQTTQYNFDTSDYGIVSTNDPTNNCSIGATATTTTCTSNAPKVTVTVDNAESTFFDSAHVLDTGGYDAVNSSPCIGGNNIAGGNTPGQCNESLQWRLIGTSGVEDPGGTVPEPSSFLLLAPGLVAWVGTRVRRRPRRT